jgi:sialidase-1
MDHDIGTGRERDRWLCVQPVISSKTTHPIMKSVRLIIARRPYFLPFGLLCLLVACLSSCSVFYCADCKDHEIDDATRQKAVEVLRKGFYGDEFWPSMHAAEGLTLSGYRQEVLDGLAPKLPKEKDDQHRCGLAREMVRAGDEAKAQVMLDILAGDDDYGHVHAAESLYKVGVIGDGVAMHEAMAQTENMKLHLMAAAALAKKGDHLALMKIRAALQSEESDDVRIAAWLLGRIGKPSDRKLLHVALARVTENSAKFEPVVTEMITNALAALGDPLGIAALEKSLDSEDPAFRTYAATFAGDAGLTKLTPKLIEMLDDPHEDAAIRAAQTLLVFDRR